MSRRGFLIAYAIIRQESIFLANSLANPTIRIKNKINWNLDSFPIALESIRKGGWTGWWWMGSLAALLQFLLIRGRKSNRIIFFIDHFNNAALLALFPTPESSFHMQYLTVHDLNTDMLDVLYTRLL